MASATDAGSSGAVGRTPVAVARDATNPFRSEPSGRSTQRDLGTVSANAHPSAVLPMPREPYTTATGAAPTSHRRRMPISCSRCKRVGRSSAATRGWSRPPGSVAPRAARAERPRAFRASPSVVVRPSTSTVVRSMSPRIWRACRTPASVRAYTRIFRRCPRRRVSRESARPSSWSAFRVRGTWLRRSRAPSAIPAWVASRPGSGTFQNPWRWTRTRSAAVSSTMVPMRPRLLKRASPDSHATRQCRSGRQEVRELEAAVAQDALARPNEHRFRQHGTCRYERMEFTVLAARVNSRRQVVEEGVVEDAATKGGIQHRGVYARHVRDVAAVHEAPGEPSRVLAPQRKKSVEAHIGKVALAMLPYVREEEVAMHDVRDPLRLTRAERGTHAGFVLLVAA